MCKVCDPNPSTGLNVVDLLNILYTETQVLLTMNSALHEHKLPAHVIEGFDRQCIRIQNITTDIAVNLGISN